MIKSISYWAFPGGLEGSKPIVEAMSEAKEMGYDAIELCIGDEGELNVNSKKKQCEMLVRLAKRIGIKISSVASGVYWGYNFSSDSAQKRNKCLSACKKMIQITQWLGTDALLYIPGAVDVFFDPESEVIPYDVAWKRMTEYTKKLLPTAEKAGVCLCVENVWNKLFQSPLELAQFVDQFKSKYVGVYFDVGNVLKMGYPEQWIRILGKRIKRVHFKDFKLAVGTADGFCDLLEGDVNWPAVIDALNDIKYKKSVTAEMIPLYAHYPQVRLQNTSNAMDAILGRA